nr:hypothetical protein [Tanacetum cinerariifolium]
MPIESNEPPDPLFDELCSLTKMTSAEEIRDASLNVTKVKKRLRSSKVFGKACGRNDTSLVDNRGGKRAENAPVDNLINK